MLNGGTDRDMLSVITQPLQIPNLPAINVSRYVRLYVRASSTKRFSDFNEIWYVDKGDA